MTNVWTDAKEVVGQVAPALATILGGPLAGTAVGEVTKVLGLDPASSPAQVSAALQTATPAQLVALKQADDDFKEKMKSLDLDWDKMDQSDRADARARQTAEKDMFPMILGAVLVLGFVTVIILILCGFNKADTALASVLIGYLAASANQVVAYYFGSSSSSRAKDAMLFASTPTNPPPAVPQGASS